MLSLLPAWVGLTIFGSAIGHGGGGMSRPDCLDAPEFIAAAALHSASRVEATFADARWLFVDEARPMTTRAFAKRLSELIKPVECVSSDVAGVVSVTCNQVTARRLARLDEQPLLTRLDAFGSSQGRNREDSFVLLRVETSSCLCPIDVVRSFLTDYRVINILLGLSDDDPEGILQGAVARLAIGPAPQIRADQRDAEPPT